MMHQQYKNNKNNDSKSLVLLVAQILLVAILVLYLLAKPQGLPVWLFWPIIWGIIILTIAGFKLSAKYRIIMLVLLELALLAIPMLSLPEVFHTGKDAIFESQYASIITRENRWDPSLGTGLAENYYGHNPVIHFMLAFLSLTTGLSTFVLTKYLFVIILRVVFVLTAYLLISTIISKKNTTLAYFATIIFMATARLMFMGVSRRFVAAIFMMMAFYLIFKKQESSKIIWTLLFFILSAMIIISDHSLTYMFMAILFIVLIISKLTGIFSHIKLFSFFRKYKMEIPNIFPKFFFFIGMWLFWNFIVTQVLIRVDVSYLTKIMGFFSSQGGGILSGPELAEVTAVNINYLYENILIYASQLVFLLLGVIGLILIIRYLYTRYHDVKIHNVKYQKAKDESDYKIISNDNISLFLFLGIFSIGMYVVAGFLMLTSWDVIPQVYLWFFSLPISILVVYTLFVFSKKFISKKLSMAIIILIVLLFYTGGLLLGYVPTIMNRAPNEDIVLEFTDSKNQQLYSSGIWLKNNAQPGSVVLGDPSVFDIYSGFYEFEVITDDYARDLYQLSDAEYVNYFVGEPIKFGYYTHTMKDYLIDYVVINNQIFKYPSFLVGNPLDEENKKNFDNARIDKIYDNQGIQIYHNYNK